MHNWSVDISQLKKDKKRFAQWRLEQMINFGTDGEKISSALLKKHWKKLMLDEKKRQFLGYLVWGKKFLAKSK